jgi:hypothetical protein
MQKKYFGDVTDFYKYFFLKNIIGEYRLGINWCMTSDDESTDGKNKVENEPRLEINDKYLYNILLKRNFNKIQSGYFSENTKYYDKIYKEFNMEYIYETLAFNELKGQDIIFFDPDTGIEMPSKKLSERYKYVSYRILSEYWNENKSLIIFQHKDRGDTLEDKKKSLIQCLECNQNDILIVNSKKVYYICVINKKHKNIRESIINLCKNNNKLKYCII